jgi:hypothetical protein
VRVFTNPEFPEPPLRFEEKEPIRTPGPAIVHFGGHPRTPGLEGRPIAVSNE